MCGVKLVAVDPLNPLNPVVHLLYTGDTIVIYQYNKDDDDGVGVDYNDNCDEVYGEDNAGMLMTRMRRTLIGIVW